MNETVPQPGGGDNAALVIVDSFEAPDGKRYKVELKREDDLLIMRGEHTDIPMVMRPDDLDTFIKAYPIMQLTYNMIHRLREKENSFNG